MTAPPTQVGSRARLRSWLMLVIALSLVGGLLAAWGFYVRVFTKDRYVQLPPGTPLIDANDYSLRPLKFTRMAAQPGSSADSDPVPAALGAEWVIVDIEVTAHNPGPDQYCTPRLVGRDGRVWESGTLYASDVALCDEMQPGETRLGAVAYEVPSREIDTLYGITVETYDGTVDEVARPG